MNGYDPYNSGKPVSQKTEILAFIQNNGSITRSQAATRHIYELSSRIGELEKDGWEFDRNDVTGRNRYGRKWRCTRYSNAVKTDHDEQGHFDG